MVLNKSRVYINPPFSYDSAPPKIPLELVCIRNMENEPESKIIDLDGRYFLYIDKVSYKYELMQYLFGGFTFSYPLKADIPINYFPFEELYTGELLIALIYNIDYTEILQKICREFNLDYYEAANQLLNIINFIDEQTILLANYDSFLFNCKSYSSIFSTTLIVNKIKKMNKNSKIYCIGKFICTPYIYNFCASLKIFDFITDNSKLINYQLYNKNAYTQFEIKDFEMNLYDTFHGMYVLSYACSFGCPHKCNFCSICLDWNQFGSINFKYIKKELNVIKRDILNIETVFGPSKISLEDCTLNDGSIRSYELLKLLAKTNMIFSGTLRADNLSDEYINLLKEAKFTNVIVGVETISENSAIIMEKGNKNYTVSARRALPLLYLSGLDVQINILLCHPYENIEDINYSLKEWENYSISMKRDYIPFINAPVGTLSINYPSKMYQNVIADNNFSVIYHIADQFIGKIPDEVSTAFKQIPHYAIKIDMINEKNINKMDFVKNIYLLWDENQSIIQNNEIRNCMLEADKFVAAWKRNKKIITTGENTFPEIIKIDELKLIDEIIKECPVNFNDIVHCCPQIPELELAYYLIFMEKMKIITFT